MKCLCCNKEILESSSVYERKVKWHKKCIKRFFNIDTLPNMDLSNKSIEDYATESIFQGAIVPGVQKKLALHLSKDSRSLTVLENPSSYIIKPQTKDYDNLPENEHLVMTLADSLSIKTAPHALIMLEGQYVYITKRIDRIGPNNDKLAMEDFCQLSQRLTEDKYRSSYEKCAKVIKEYSAMPISDLTEFFYRLIFCFVTGNSDMHLKNFSLLETFPSKREFLLSPSYDLLSVKIVLPEDKEDFALTMNGKKTKIKREDFIKFGISIGLKERVCINLIDKIVTSLPSMITICEEADYIVDELKEKLISLISERCKLLK